jgi:hypothetical protein
MGEYAIRPLDAATWDACVHLAEKHNGVWKGCWCTWFHPGRAERGESPRGDPVISRSCRRIGAFGAFALVTTRRKGKTRSKVAARVLD